MSERQGEEPHKVDRRAVEMLFDGFLKTIKPHLAGAASATAANYEVLNALAWATSVMLSGAEGDDARQFFDSALNVNLVHLAEQKKAAGDG